LVDYFKEGRALGYVREGLGLSIFFFIVIAIIGVCMRFANHIGETFGIGNLFMTLWKKRGKNK